MAPVALRSLRYTADFDSSTYVRGMAAKVAADQAGAASSKAVGAALAQADAAMDAAGGRAAWLSRSLIDGYGSAARFEMTIRSIGRAVDAGMGLDRAAVLVEAASKKFGLTADAAALAKQGYVSLAPVIAEVNARYTAQAAAADAAAAAMRRAADAQNASSQMLAGMGAIGGPRVADLAANQRLIAGMSGAMDRFGESAGKANFQTKQLSFQLFDIAQGVPLAFQSPIYGLQNLAVQTGQVAQLYMGQGGLKQAFKETGEIAKSVGAGLVTWLVTPLGQVALIAGAVGVAITALFVNESREAHRAEEALKTHIDLIGRIKNAYREAGDAVTGYGGESLRVLKALDTEAQRQVAEQLNKAALTTTDPSGRYGGLSAMSGEISAKTHDAMVELRKEAAAGAADWRRYGNALVDALNDPEISSGQRKILMGLIAEAAERAKLQREIRAPSSMRELEQKSMKDDLTLILEQRADMERIRLGLSADLRAIRARSPSEIGAATRAQGQANRTDFGTVESLRIEREAALAAAQAEFQLSEAQRQRGQAARDSLEAAQLEFDLIGKGVGQSELLRANWQAYADLRREAEDNNTAFDEAQFQRLKAINEEMAKLAELTARAQLRSDLRFDRSQIFRSDREQNVADQMRSIYGDDYLSHMHDFEAQQIRINDQLKEFNDIGRDVVGGFLSDFRDGLRDGASFFDAFSAAGEKALTKIEDKLFDMATNKLLDTLLGSLFGGGGGGLVPYGGPPLVGAGLFHSGGIVGAGGQTRYVHPAYFDDAPRMHRGGIAGDEMAAILKRGERVLPVGQSAASGMVVNINNYGGSDIRKRESTTPGGGRRLDIDIDSAVIKSLRKPGVRTAGGLGSLPGIGR